MKQSDLQRSLRLGFGVLLALGAAFRLVQAARGSIPAARAAADFALCVGFFALFAVARRHITAASRAGTVAVGLVLVAWGATVAVPLVRLGYPSPPLMEIVTAEGNRQTISPPVPEEGLYVASMAPRRASKAVSETPSDDAPGCTVQLPGAPPLRVRALPQGDSVRFAAVSGMQLTILCEAAASGHVLRVAPAPPARAAVLLGLGLALVLALVAEALLARSWPRGRGVLTTIVGASAVFVALASGSPSPGATTLGGMALLAVVAGGLAGGLAAALLGAVARRLGH